MCLAKEVTDSEIQLFIEGKKLQIFHRLGLLQEIGREVMSVMVGRKEEQAPAAVNGGDGDNGEHGGERERKEQQQWGERR